MRPTLNSLENKLGLSHCIVNIWNVINVINAVDAQYCQPKFAGDRLAFHLLCLEAEVWSTWKLAGVGGAGGGEGGIGMGQAEGKGDTIVWILLIWWVGKGKAGKGTLPYLVAPHEGECPGLNSRTFILLYETLNPQSLWSKEVGVTHLRPSVSVATLLIWAFLKMVLKENLCWEWHSLPSW